MDESISFRPRARLMAQLGEQLIKDENIAVLELIKNSYDADAKEVKVTMKNLESPDQGVIIIEDNGDGMSFDIVKNCWMEPGTDNKEKKLKKMIMDNIRSKLNRLPMGEKGIGRFGVHKLGNKITLITKSENQKEVYIEIDWTIFNSSKYLSEVPIKVIERDSSQKFLSNSSTGTKIIIEKLKVKWNRGKVRSLYRSINSLNSPFESIDSFNIIFDIDNKDWIKGLVKYEDIKDYALFKCTMILSGHKIKDYQYDFIPWKSMNKLECRSNYETEIDMFSQVRETGNNGKTRRVNKDIDLSKFKIGNVKIELLSFDLDTKILNMSVKDVQGLKAYLKVNGGIFVYRDNIKIYEAGENDWLGLGVHRVSAPGDRISNNLVLGSVNIDRKESEDLKEKTNREGFIEDTAYDIFRDAVLFAVGKFERDRALDKELLRKYYGTTSKSEPVISAVSEVREKVENKISDEKLKKQILGCLNNIEKDYKHITEIYQKSSSAGLSMNVVLHEIDKIISELEYAIIAENTSDHIKMLVKRLEDLTDGYSAVMKSKSIKMLNLKKIIRQSIFMVDFRLQAHEIKVIEKYMDNDEIFKVKGNDNLLASIIVNIIDNSIWWLNFAKVKSKSIYFDITKDIPGYISIIIADNGKGFTIPTEMATKPFITDKPGGMGLGLHLASELMKQHGGNLIFPEFDDLQIPDEFSNGAIVALAFKEE